METHDDFICICSEDGRKDAEILMAEVKHRLSQGSEQLQTRGVTDADFLTAVVVSLNWDFQAVITGIYNDQWSVVHAEDDDKTFHTRIQCDLVEHGVAATWKAFADRKQHD